MRRKYSPINRIESGTIEPMLTLTVNSTHFYLVDCRGGMLLFDAGWELARGEIQGTAGYQPAIQPSPNRRYSIVPQVLPERG